MCISYFRRERSKNRAGIISMDAPETISFETISNAFRKERDSHVLQPLPRDFFEKAKEYLARKRGELDSAKARAGRFSNKLVKQHENELDNAMMAINQLCELRDKKIMILALSQSRITEKADLELTPEEKVMFDGVLDLVKKKRMQIFGEEVRFEVEEPKKEEKKAEKPAGKEVEFMEDTPKFLGLDLKSYGPYKAGDRVNLPDELIELLVSRGKARLVG